MHLDEYRREILHGNGDHSANVTRLEKLEEMQGSIVRRRMPTKLIKPAMLFMSQKRWLQMVNEMRMLRWMYGMTRQDKIRNDHLRGTTRVVHASQKITEGMSNR